MISQEVIISLFDLFASQVVYNNQAFLQINSQYLTLNYSFFLLQLNLFGLKEK
jgi:hypothetical protein